MKKILIINPFGIGDCLFTTPLIKNLKLNYNDSFIGYWCNKRVKDLLQNIPEIDKIFPSSRGDIKKAYRNSKLKGIKQSLDLFLALKKEKFNLAIDFSLDHRYGLVAKLCGIKERIGFNYKNRGRFLTKRIELTGYSEKHAVEYYLDLLRLINLEPKKFDLEVGIQQGSRISVKKILAESGISDGDLLIGMAPGAGASWGDDAGLKHWPAKNYAQLADLLIEKFAAKILLLGDSSERPIAETITNSMQHKAVDLIGKSDLAQLVALIDSTQILITNDGGPLHIAVALKKKTVSFFGPVDDKVYGPYPEDKERHIVLKNNLDCIPCYHNFRLSECKSGRACLEKIDAKSAFEAVSFLLSVKK